MDKLVRYDPEIHHRRSLRLQGYDYAQAGVYFVTVCTWNRECLLGDVTNGEIRLNDAGMIVSACWLAITEHFPDVELDAFVVMPNHVHGIIGICRRGEAFGPSNASPLPPHGTQPGSLGAITQNFKSISTRKINQVRDATGTPVWQRNYYEHIIRDENSLNLIRRYILGNLDQWAEDEDNPDRLDANNLP